MHCRVLGPYHDTIILIVESKKRRARRPPPSTSTPTLPLRATEPPPRPAPPTRVPGESRLFDTILFTFPGTTHVGAMLAPTPAEGRLDGCEKSTCSKEYCPFLNTLSLQLRERGTS